MSLLLDKKEKLKDINEELFEQYKSYVNIFARSSDDYLLIKEYRQLLNSSIKIAKIEMKKANCESIYSVDNLKYLPSGSCMLVGVLNLQKQGKGNGTGVYRGVKIVVLNAKEKNITRGILKYKSNAKNVYTFEYLGKIVDKKFEGVFISSIIATEIHNLLKNERKNLKNDAKEQEKVSKSSDKVMKEIVSKLQTTQDVDYYSLLGNLGVFLKDLRRENDGATDLIEVYKSDAYFFNLLYAVSYKCLQKNQGILLGYQKAYIDNYSKAKSSYENYYQSLLDFNVEMGGLKYTKNYFAGLILKMQNDTYENILKNNKKIEIFNQDIVFLNKKYKVYELKNKQLDTINFKTKPKVIGQSEKEVKLYKKDIGEAYRNKYFYEEIKKNDKLKDFLIKNVDYDSGLHSGLYFGLYGDIAEDTNANMNYGTDFSMGYFYKNFALGFDFAGYGENMNNLNYSVFMDLKFNLNPISFTGLYFMLGYGLDINNKNNQFAKVALGYNIPLIRFGNVQSSVLGLDFNIGYIPNINESKDNFVLSIGLLLVF